MEISHVMRGDEWLPSLPKRALLYDALGWEMPIFAHLPLILAPTGKGKLSKRHGGVEIREFRSQGYLPEAMVNYLARVGWSYDDKTEIFDREELVRFFDLSGINSSPARFSYERLEWMNAYYIRQLRPDDLAERLVPFMDQGRLRGHGRRPRAHCAADPGTAQDVERGCRAHRFLFPARTRVRTRPARSVKR